MLASLYYLPMWIFYRGEETMDQIGDLRYRRIAVGVEGGGTRAFAGPLLAINGLTTGIVMVPMSNSAALRALTSKEVRRGDLRRRRAESGRGRPRCATVVSS